jgi:hypothetical protein
MLRTTLLAAATLVAFGTTAAYAGSDGGHGHKGHGRGNHGGYEHNYVPGPQAGRYHRHRGHYGGKRGYRHGRSWFDYRGRPHCHVAPRKVPIKVWDRRGNSYRKWVWKDVRVCV